jgi:hypothetical protein
MPPQTPEPNTTTPTFLSRRQIILAMLGGVILILVLTGVTLTLPPRGISIISNLMLTCMCLLPIALCLFPVFLVLVLAIYGMNRVNTLAGSQMDRARSASAELATRSSEITDNLNRRSVNLSAVMARLDPLFNLFDRPKSDGDHLNGN